MTKRGLKNLSHYELRCLRVTYTGVKENLVIMNYGA